MTPAELEAKVARAMRGLVTKYDEQEAAEIVLAVVREALREPTPEMVAACLDRDGSDDDLYVQIWRAMLAASPLREGGE